ncbi:BQ2448_7515 [Microbotryum intermedium]|uniref:BQ2448_7515 protein n=1 Tax=Microbotryum intermedium TaxID=269621 RepID=A0A238FLD7_9BASI|nr:BQ2448_7515 [Microbotryum intermedium]
MLVQVSKCLQSFAKSLTAFLYLQSAFALPQSLSISGSSRSQSSSSDERSGDGSSSSSTASQALAKRGNCKPTCPRRTRLDSRSMPACAWNCVTWSSSVIKDSEALVPAITTVVFGILGYTARRATTSHTGKTGKRDNATLHAFSSAIDDIFGTKDRKRGGSDLHTVDYATLFANGTVDGIYTEFNVTANQAAAYIGDSYASGWVKSELALEKRSDTLTNAMVIYHNAKIDDQVEIRSFTPYERRKTASTIARRFSYICQHHGRAMCDCLRSGLGNEFVGALTVEGQADNNGQYQPMNCDCDTRAW